MKPRLQQITPFPDRDEWTDLEAVASRSLATPLRLQVELKQGGGATPRNEIYVEVSALIDANLYAPSMGVTSLSPTRQDGEALLNEWG